MKDNSTSTEELICQNVGEMSEHSVLADEFAELIQPLKESFLNKNNTFDNKITCLSAIEAIISRETSAYRNIAEIELIDEIAHLVSEIVSRDERDQKNYLEPIAKILAKLNCTNDGMNLVQNMRLSFGAFEKLKAEMKKFELNPDPSHLHVKTET